MTSLTCSCRASSLEPWAAQASRHAVHQPPQPGRDPPGPPQRHQRRGQHQRGRPRVRPRHRQTLQVRRNFSFRLKVWFDISYNINIKKLRMHFTISGPRTLWEARSSSTSGKRQTWNMGRRARPVMRGGTRGTAPPTTPAGSPSRTSTTTSPSTRLW